MISAKIRWKYFSALFMCVICTIYLGITTNAKLKSITKDNDKLAHFVAFFVDTWLFVRCIVPKYIDTEAIFGRFGPLRRIVAYGDLDSGQTVMVYRIPKYVLVIGLVIVAAVGSELLQPVLSGGKRTFDVWDIAGNLLGGLTGVAGGYLCEM
ncbi:HDL323Wp [Eremothecium sinecaudum]|uniref:HDL323Wp n=1 Tax=Eremothecium sinecaudum TaxID=45286 RepID=A0A0X8HS33_9SACH|nr:HDL323Wp [Eremothecium sinecaudum]AMD20421.1 HDL323Wp [Eremothecium sinecaudum]